MDGKEPPDLPGGGEALIERQAQEGEGVGGGGGQQGDAIGGVGEVGRALTSAAQDRPLPDWAADAGRTEDVRQRRARPALLEAVARHRHGPLPDEEPGDRPW
ncbi:hypothetical protein [Kitasatospora sp. NPDC057541]|uniref:hypothetical protein n=1 Tax=unclassified Kitasatospora TaxID=2633591 RepID=UPI0036B44CEA